MKMTLPPLLAAVERRKRRRWWRRWVIMEKLRVVAEAEASEGASSSLLALIKPSISIITE